MASDFDCKLNKETREEIKEAFDLFDKDGDGKIKTHELRFVIRALGQHANEVQLQDMINEVDVDGEGFIGFKEFLMIMERHMTDTSYEEGLLVTFKALDKEDNGFISRLEMRSVLQNVDAKLNDEEIDRLITEADTGNKGRIDYEKFVKEMVAEKKSILAVNLMQNSERSVTGRSSDASKKNSIK